MQAVNIERPECLDFSLQPRVAYRGKNAQTHLQACGLPIPERPNQALSNASQGTTNKNSTHKGLTHKGSTHKGSTNKEHEELVLRLSDTEFWVLSITDNVTEHVDITLQKPLPDSACYRLYCQDSHACFALLGDNLPALMAKICGVDLRTEAFPLGAIAQTSAARINVIVVHHQYKSRSCFLVLCDSAAAEYFRHSVEDALAIA